MHNSRNRLALSTVTQGHSGLRSARGWEAPLGPAATARGSFMFRERGEPGFPEDVLIARQLLPGARIVALPDAPEPKPPAKKKAAKPKAKPKRKPAKRKAASKAKAARPKKASAKKAKSATTAKARPPRSAKPALEGLPSPAPIMAPESHPVPQPSLGLLFAGGMAKAPASASVAPENRVPFLILPKSHSLTQQGPGIVARLVSWLGALLPRKRRRASLPRAKQALKRVN